MQIRIFQNINIHRRFLKRRGIQIWISGDLFTPCQNSIFILSHEFKYNLQESKFSLDTLPRNFHCPLIRSFHDHIFKVRFSIFQLALLLFFIIWSSYPACWSCWSRWTQCRWRWWEASFRWTSCRNWDDLWKKKLFCVLYVDCRLQVIFMSLILAIQKGSLSVLKNTRFRRFHYIGR